MRREETEEKLVYDVYRLNKKTPDILLTRLSMNVESS